MKEVVSILIPCYNGGKYLEECFANILKQTYNYIEVIFINDGSIDETEEIVKQKQVAFKERGYDFKYYYQENQGAAAAINLALKKLTGKYIFLYDVDDILTENAIESKVKFLSNNSEYDIVRSNGDYVKEKEINKPYAQFFSNNKEKRNEHIFEDLLYAKTVNWASSYMIRTEALFKHIKDKEIYISRYGQHLQLLLPVSYHGKSGFIDEAQAKYVQYEKSDSHSNDIKRRLELLNGYLENRIQVLKSMDISEDKINIYEKKVTKLYQEKRIRLLASNRALDLLEEEYKKLKINKQLTIKIVLIYSVARNETLYHLIKKIKGVSK